MSGLFDVTRFKDFFSSVFQDGSYLAEFLIAKGYKVRKKPSLQTESTMGLLFFLHTY